MSMFPLGVAISLDFYLIARLILNNSRGKLVIGKRVTAVVRDPLVSAAARAVTTEDCEW